MTLKELSQLYYLKREIENLQKRLDELECYAEGTTQSLSGMPGSGIPDKLGRYAAQIADLRTKIENRKIACLYELEKLNRYIDGIDDSLTRQIMSLRFINGLSWFEVANHIGGNNTADSVRMICYRYLLRAKRKD